MHRVVATSLALPIITLTNFGGLTKLSISSPDITMSKSDSQALGQLTGLRVLDLLYQPGLIVMSEPVTADVTPLSRLINLERLRVQGVVPAKPEPAATAAWGVAGPAQLAAGGQQQQQGGAAGLLPVTQQLCYCLPPSLTSLSFQGTRNGLATEPIMVQHWVLHAAGAPHIKQLHLKGFRVGEGFLDEFLGELDLSPLSGLTELRCVCAPETDMEFNAQVDLHSSLTALRDLEVLWVGTENSPYPWEQHYWEADSSFLGQVSQSCKKLREVWKVGAYQSLAAVSTAVKLDQLTSLYKMFWNGPQAWFTPRAVPQLQQLTVDCRQVTTESVARIAQLTSLTSLRIDTGLVYVEGMVGGGWCGLEALGRGLTRLQRLELGNHHGQCIEDDDGLPLPLTLPDLSAFTQIKQLRLTCAVNLTKPMPRHPSAMDFLSCLLPLTRLEQLQVSGYSAVNTGLLRGLLGALPRLTEVQVVRPLPRAVGAFCVWAAAGGVAGATAAVRAGAAWPPPAEVLRELQELRPGIKLTLL